MPEIGNQLVPFFCVLKNPSIKVYLQYNLKTLNVFFTLLLMYNQNKKQ